MLVRINEETLIDPQSARIAMIEGPLELPGRKIWVTSVARPGKAIEVAAEWQDDLLKALQVRLGEFK